MTQVSRRPVPKEIESKIYESFYKAIGLLNDSDSRMFVDDILTHTEKIMIPKRFAIAILLVKGRRYDDIRDSLKVTQTTISSVARVLEFSRGLRKAIEKLEKDRVWAEWWEGIESLIFRLNNPRNTFIDEELIKKKLGHRNKTLV